MTGLPQGWASVAVRDVIEDYDTIDPQRMPDQRFAYVDIGAIDNSVQKITDPKDFLGKDAPSRARRVIRTGDVLFSTVRTYLKNVAQVPPELDGQLTSTGICVLRANAATDPNYLFRWACSTDFINEISQAQDGTMYPAVRDEDVLAGPIPLPPLPEQRRIVRKLDTLSARSTTARTHLTAIEKLVERYKSGVLGLELSGVPLGNEADEQNTQPITNDNERGAWTFEALPTHWVWTGFKAFLENQTDSYRKLPQKDYQSEGEYPVIDQGADLIGGYSNDATLLLPAQPPYIIFGDHTRCVKFFEAPFVQGADGVKVFHAGKDVDIRFAYWALKGLQLPDKGYSRHAKFLKESYFPRPPIDEQREIVRRIEAAFAKIDRLQVEAAKALKLLGHLDQRILAKAFAGDLVSQDPNDEPAETLLARIREARANAPEKTRQRRTKVYAMKEAPKDRLLADSAMWPRNGLPFEDIAARIAMPHDELRDAIFELLGGEKPLLEQIFDTSEERMRLKRVAQ